MATKLTSIPKNLTEYPNSFKRQGAFPLEAYSVFYSLDDAKTYAANNPLSYVGQIITVVDSNNNVTAYMIKSTDGQLTEVGMGDESQLQWGKNNIAGSVSPVDAACSSLHSANRFQFANPDGIIIEYSRDAGSTWTPYPCGISEKVKLVSATSGVEFYIGARRGTNTNTTSDKLRITLDATRMEVYTRLRKLLINITTNYATGSYVKVDISNKGSEDTFKEDGTYPIAGWSGWNSIPIGAPSGAPFGGGGSQTTNYAKIRLTFGITGVKSGYVNTLTVYDINAIGDVSWTSPSTMARTGHIYSIDSDKNTTFPADISATTFCGTSMSVTGNTFNNLYYNVMRDIADVYGNNDGALLIIPEGTTILKTSAVTNESKIKAVAIPSSVETIYSYVFNDCINLTHITIPDTVKRAEGYLFNGCSSLTSIEIGDGLTYIDPAFCVGSKYYETASNWENGAYNTTLYIGKYLLQAKGSGTFTIRDGTRCIAADVFGGANSSGITNIIFPKSLKVICADAFEGMRDVKSIKIPDSVTFLGPSAFRTSHITDLVIGNGVPEIYYNLCSSCSYLQSVKIGDGVKTIGKEAFYSCTSLASIVIGSSVTSIGQYAFTAIKSDATITLKCANPPTYNDTTSCPFTSGCGKIFVPSGSVAAYKSAWPNYASKIEADPATL